MSGLEAITTPREYLLHNNNTKNSHNKISKTKQQHNNNNTKNSLSGCKNKKKCGSGGSSSSSSSVSSKSGEIGGVVNIGGGGAIIRTDETGITSNKKKRNSNNNNKDKKKNKKDKKGKDKDKNRKKKRKNSIPEEDVVDGFTFKAFKNYEDIQRSLSLSEASCPGGGVGVKKNKAAATNRSTSTNTSPLAPKNKQPKFLQQNHLLTPLLTSSSAPSMDQENGENGEGPRPPGHNNHHSYPSHPPPAKKKKNANKNKNKVVTEIHPVPLLPPTPVASADEDPPPTIVDVEAEDEGSMSLPSVASQQQEAHPRTPSITNIAVPASNGHTIKVKPNTPPPQPPAQVVAPKVTSFFAPYAQNAVTRVDHGGQSLPQPPPTNGNGVDFSPAAILNGATPPPPLVSHQTKQNVPIGQSSSSNTKSQMFGSIARLLDSPTASMSSSTSASSTSPTQPNNHSPRGHSPSRERDSYSSTVSSLSSSTPAATIPPPTPTSPKLLPSHPSPPSLWPPPARLTPSYNFSPVVANTPVPSQQQQRDFLLPLMSRPPLVHHQQQPHPHDWFLRGLPQPYGQPPLHNLTPFAPPATQLPPMPQKRGGRWNVMHVRIAWEIYHHQNKGDRKPLQPTPPPPPPDIFRPPFSSYPSGVQQRAADVFRPPPPSSLMEHQVQQAQAQQQQMLLHHLAASGGVGLGGRYHHHYATPTSMQDAWARLGRGGWGEDHTTQPNNNDLTLPPPRPISPFRERSPIIRSNGDNGISNSEDKSQRPTSSSRYGSSSIIPLPTLPMVGAPTFLSSPPDPSSSSSSFRTSLLQLGERPPPSSSHHLPSSQQQQLHHHHLHHHHQQQLPTKNEGGGHHHHHQQQQQQ